MLFSFFLEDQTDSQLENYEWTVYNQELNCVKPKAIIKKLLPRFLMPKLPWELIFKATLQSWVSQNIFEQFSEGANPL